jgi:hypothetical protein
VVRAAHSKQESESRACILPEAGDALLKSVALRVRRSERAGAVRVGSPAAEPPGNEVFLRGVKLSEEMLAMFGGAWLSDRCGTCRLHDVPEPAIKVGIAGGIVKPDRGPSSEAVPIRSARIVYARGEVECDAQCRPAWHLCRKRDCAGLAAVGETPSFMSLPLSTAASARPPKPNAAAGSVFMIVLVGTYISIGALAHDLGFPVVWVVFSTILIWAAPAQVILITSLAAGTAPLEAGIVAFGRRSNRSISSH